MSDIMPPAEQAEPAEQTEHLEQTDQPEHGEQAEHAGSAGQAEDAAQEPQELPERELSEEARSARRRRIIFCATISLICAALIGLIWIATGQAVRDQRAEIMARATSWVEAQSNLLTESARRELATIDQSLVMMESVYRANPQQFSLATWQDSLPGLNEVVKEFFIANSQDVIVQDTLPQAVGQGIGGAYATFGRGDLEQFNQDSKAGPSTKVLLGEVRFQGVARQYLMYLVRPIPGQPGWLVGASYRSSALVKEFGEGGLGARGLAALIDTRHAGVQAVAGPAALHPILNVGATQMYKAFQNKGYSGVWIGPSGMDDVPRIHAFHRVPGRDLVAVVGLDLHDWMAPTEAWAQHARELAALASLLVLAIGGLVLWWLWTLETNRRLRNALEISGNPDMLMGTMRNAIESSADGLALMGADGRLVAWNPSFASATGVSTESLQRGLAVEEMLRRRTQQIEARQPGAPGTMPDGFEPGSSPDDSDTPADPTFGPDQGADSAHLIERAAERLLQAGALESSAANLLKSGAGSSSGFGLPPGLGSPEIFIPPSIDVVALERAGMVDWSRTRSRVSEEFRLVQRQLLNTAFSGPNVQPGFSNLVMVTSARPGEGKSFTSLNLAGSISRQGDYSVLLVDADSKRDSFCYPLGLADSPGLLDLAADPRLDAGQCIVKTPLDHLSILPIGRERERGPELFSSKEMARLIQALGRRYSDRLVILDAPPCLSTSDPAVLAGVVGQILMVVEAERTQRDEIEAAVELVQECPNLVLVLNKQRAASRFHFGAYASYYSS